MMRYGVPDDKAGQAGSTGALCSGRLCVGEGGLQ